MRKIVLLILLIITPFFVYAYPQGDVDGNNVVKTSDYLLIRKHILGSSLLTGDRLERADVNGDGKVNLADYIAIRRILLNNNVTIKLNKSVVNLETNDKYKLSYSITPNSEVIWSSSNEKIATINDGVITTGSVFGTAKITVSTKDGLNKAEVTVNVTKERIHFINIGEAGNAILLDSYYGGKNHYVLIDAAICNNDVDCGKTQVDSYIGSKVQPVNSEGVYDSNRVKKIDAVIISHMHYDHAGYMAKIIEKYKPNEVIIKKYSVSKSYLNDIKKAANKVGSKIVYPSEGSEYTYGNFSLKIYNTKDLIGNGSYSENINSLVVMVSVTMGDKTYLSYLPGDLETGKNKNTNKVILDAANISKKIRDDYGLSLSRPIDIYVASHHGYYNDDGYTGNGIAKGVNNNATVIEPLYIKSSIITNTFGWLCSKSDKTQYQGIKNIYDNLVKNNGDLNIRFSGAKRVKAIFRAKGIELDGGEILTCNNNTCGSTSSIYKTIKSAAPQCSRKNYIK